MARSDPLVGRLPAAAAPELEGHHVPVDHSQTVYLDERKLLPAIAVLAPDSNPTMVLVQSTSSAPNDLQPPFQGAASLSGQMDTDILPLVPYAAGHW